MNALDDGEKAIARDLAEKEGKGDWTPLLKKSLVTAESGRTLCEQDMTPELWAALIGMKNGETRQVKTPAGEFLIRRIELLPAGMRPLDAVRREIIEILTRNRQEQIWSEFLIRKQKELLNR
jgi:hypothetical protein